MKLIPNQMEIAMDDSNWGYHFGYHYYDHLSLLSILAYVSLSQNVSVCDTHGLSMTGPVCAWTLCQSARLFGMETTSKLIF